MRAINKYVMGIDLGTSGVRALVIDALGNVAARAMRKLDKAEVPGLPAGWHEQRAEMWWEACSATIRQALAELSDRGINTDLITAISVTSTSGTIVPLDIADKPLRPALMYNDNRSEREASALNEMTPAFSEKMGRGFASSFALPKMLWIKRNERETFALIKHWAHAGDYIVGRLTGEYGISDYSTALKTGLDLIDLRWPDFIQTQAGIPLNTLPRIVRPGAVIATISAACSAETGLAPKTVVCAGMTDSSAALLAAGASDPGDWNTTIGTTLAVKGISRDMIRDPSGVVYCHLHPAGWWMPGAASNVGGECVEMRFSGRNFSALDASAEARGPSSAVCYPLVRRGERFPFIDSQAEGFMLGEPQDEVDLYRSLLEGVGLVEKLAYEKLAGLGATIGDQIFVAGGAAKSRVWLQIRANILGKELVRPALPESATGAAILAASTTLFENVSQAGQSMVHMTDTIRPDPSAAGQYDDKYARLLREFRKRGYLA